MATKKIRLSTLLIIGTLIHGSISLELFETGKEYRYQYLGLFTTGTEEPVSHASSYKLKGTLRIQGTGSNILNIKLADVSIGLYNGKWSYFPTPDFKHIRDERLDSIQEPFQLQLTNDGKFKTLIMNDQEPEFASNLKRGLATYLQLNLTAGFDRMQIFKETESTTMGECPTGYEITPVTSSKTGFVRIGKFRNHADCPDVPTRTRYGHKAYHRCSNDQTRDIVNSTSYAVYDLSLDEQQRPTINHLTVLSSILYWPFTSSGQFLYTWYNLTLALDQVGPITDAIGGPENAENHEDLSFAFEQSDYQEAEDDIVDLKAVEPFFFHQTSSDSQPEALAAISLQVKTAVEEVAESLENQDSFQDFKKFHDNSPLKITRLLNALDYDALKQLYTSFAEGSKDSNLKLTELQLFIDGLMISGTAPAALVIRDILVKETEDSEMLGRIAHLFPTYIRNPSEALAKEMEQIFDLTKKPKISKPLKRAIELSMATLISKGCEKTLCSSSGLLDKYISYFEDKLLGATNFEEQTVAILGLRNLRIGRALDKVLEIAVGNVPYDNAVRIQAIWSIRPLIFQDSIGITKTLLEVFYNRTESCETRTSIFGLIMSSNPEERTLHEIAYFMWSETCPQTMNIVRATLTLLSKSKSPCNKVGSYAATILKYLPPGAVDPTRTTFYLQDFFDEKNGYGRSIYSTVQKSGKTALPVSIYVGSSDTLSGFSSAQFGIFIRLQGLEKFLPKTYYAVEDVAPKLLEILSKLQIKERKSTPLKLELTLLYLDRAILYYAADENTIMSSLAEVSKQIQNLQKYLGSPHERSMLLGEVLYQQPLEVGIPVSILSDGAAISQIVAKTESDVQRNSYNIKTDSQFQYSVYARTMITNHVPALSNMHTAGILRKLSFRLHRHFSMNGKSGKIGVGFTIYPPTAENPSILQTHATAFTHMVSEYPSQEKYLSSKALLQQSCPLCTDLTYVSKGPGTAKSNEIISLPRILGGLQGGVQQFECEKSISKAQIFSRIRDLLGDNGKNYGLFETSLAKLYLGIQNAGAYFFYWPNSDPCGFRVFIGKNNASGTRQLEKIEGSVSGEYKLDPTSFELGTITLDTTLNLKYEGSTPPTKSIAGRLKIRPAESKGSQSIQLKGIISGGTLDYNGVACIDINNQVTESKTDPLGFDGDNEPSVNQTISIKLGKLSTSDSSFRDGIDSFPCSDNHADISIEGIAERSQEQIDEAGSTQPTSFPYLLCLLQKQTGLWPKNLVPPTPECLQVVVDQTGLRKINFTVNYKVAKEVKKRWARPADFIGNILSPYIVDPEEDKVHKHKHHSIPASAEYHNGEVEIDLNLKKSDPMMDVHVIGSSGEEQHFHDIDLSLLPASLQFQPVPSRFTHLHQFLYQAGFVGTCAITPEQVVTFDNLNYPGKLTECETLVMADCGKQSTFAITARRSADSKLILTIQMGKQIEISDGEVLLDSNKISFDASGVHKVRSLIFKKQGNEITVQSFHLGLSVRFSGGVLAQITASSRVRGITCGLCGNFDTTSYNDLIGPRASSCPQSSMIAAWTIPTGKCSSTPQQC